MTSSNRSEIKDLIIDKDLLSDDLSIKTLKRIGCKEKALTKVNFTHSYFDNCYFRKVVFDSCVFYGCKFVNCNFHDCSFPGCKFDYAIFEKTYIDSEILYNNCPSHNNLKLKFARSLRINYQSIGDSKSVNKAILIELNATKEHLYEAWNSHSVYYRSKYKGNKRVCMFFKWLNFKFQDYIWGNGENALNLLKTVLLIWFMTSILDTIIYKDSNLVSNYIESLFTTPAVFVGVYYPEYYPKTYLTIITIVRYIYFALFTSILIKRFNRR